MEADPWVVNKVLGKNVDKCKASYNTTIHTAYVEKWLANANKFPQVCLWILSDHFDGFTPWQG